MKIFDKLYSLKKATAYNTHTLNNSVYEPVNQIHQNHVWAGKEIDKTKANIKFFQAAADVTGLSSVGAAYGNPFVNDRVQESLAGVNKKYIVTPFFNLNYSNFHRKKSIKNS
ncbi:hypothetical protein NAF17_13960 [Mucilaginibacter sp. RB4R14]|uniref:hypothetical protein n=1 Tax=Mucilaginibacter aurantiaciroseus TaxID=2949308 RepID=UPI002090F80C|nr:hypothetical protein [Mucilaginibacter aurantiaciroseus]MCO5936646.1 hypothetical protein [Mucilaginibacter aurantiaciroseus]